MIMPSQGMMFETYRGYETPRYIIVRKIGDIELREYQPVLMAEVEVTGQRALAIQEGFSILASYIFGSNHNDERISMTTPVFQEGAERSWKVSFMMPSRYNAHTIPLPTDERVRLRMSRISQRAVIRFSGNSGEANLAQNLARLQAHIREYGLETVGERQYLFYDSPWTVPSSRRNEIAFELKRETSRLAPATLHLLLH